VISLLELLGTIIVVLLCPGRGAPQAPYVTTNHIVTVEEFLSRRISCVVGVGLGGVGLGGVGLGEDGIVVIKIITPTKSKMKRTTTNNIIASTQRFIMEQLVELGAFLIPQDITDTMLFFLCRRLQLRTGKEFYSTRDYSGIRVDCNYGKEVIYKRIIITGESHRREISLTSRCVTPFAQWSREEIVEVKFQLSNIGIHKYRKKEHISILVEEFRRDLEKLEEKTRIITELLNSPGK
jgi:hypothetical protein